MVQRLLISVESKALKYIKEACMDHFGMNRNTYQSDKPAGEQGPLFSSIGQIQNWKLLHTSFIERDDESFKKPEENISKTSSTESEISLQSLPCTTNSKVIARFG